MKTIEGRLDANGKRFAVVAARFNQRVVDPLVEGAIDCLTRHGVSSDDLSLMRVPGAWEVPLALEELAAAGSLDGMVALAAVIRGETAHFDYICGECSRGVARVQAKYRIPIGFGVLTCDTSAQAEARSGGKAGNKGWEAAQAAIEMVGLITQVKTGDDGARPAGIGP